MPGTILPVFEPAVAWKDNDNGSWLCMFELFLLDFILYYSVKIVSISPQTSYDATPFPTCCLAASICYP